MAVNLLEENRLVYHDQDANTLEITISDGSRDLEFWTDFGTGEGSNRVVVDLDAVETLRDSLTCWLETGKLNGNRVVDINILADKLKSSLSANQLLQLLQLLA